VCVCVCVWLRRVHAHARKKTPLKNHAHTNTHTHTRARALTSRQGKEGLTRWIHIEPLVESVLKKFAVALKINDTAVKYSLLYPQRATFEAYDECVFVVMQATSLRDPDDCLSGLLMQQLSVFLCANNVVLSTCLQSSGTLLDPIRTRLRHGISALRHGNASFLLNSLINQVAGPRLLARNDCARAGCLKRVRELPCLPICSYLSWVSPSVVYTL
jgi:Mg2+ and Co2+ transporter CorA